MRRIISLLAFGLLAAKAAAAPQKARPAEAEYAVKAIAAVLVAEAGCDKQPGLLAVAEVIRNRAREKHKTPLAIVKQPGVFSSLLEDSLDSLIAKQSRHPQYPAALKLARKLVKDPASLPNTTRRATHFDHVGNQPFWALTARPTTVIGNHRFYRTAY